MNARSLLFVPGDSARKLEKSLSAGADLLILDLEDSVTAQRKSEARTLVAALLRDRDPQRGASLWVRINALDTPDAAMDLAAFANALPDGIVVPKLEFPADIRRLSEELCVLERAAGVPQGQVRIMPIIETPRGVLQAAGMLAIDTARLGAITWGAEDLAASLGMRRRSSNQGNALQAARTQSLLIACAVGVAAVETVTTNIKDFDALRADCAAARADGFSGKLAIHPDQVPIINEAFSPSADDLAWARRVIAAFDSGNGAATLDGRMIDIVHWRQAQALVRLAGP